MRVLALTPLLVLTVACGSSKLEKSTAEKLLKQDYPAVVLIKVPRTATAEKGSEKLARITRINELLRKEPWVEVRTEEKDGKVRSTYTPSASAPKTVRPGPENIEVPAALVEFVGATRMEGGKNGPATVTFLVRMAKPSGLWPLYEFLHPGAKLGQPIERKARFERADGKWSLTQTDETARIKP